MSSKRRKGAKEQPPIPKSVHLIDSIEEDSDEEDTDEERDSFAFNEHVVIKGEFDLTTGDCEVEIRSELVEVFKTKIPTIRTTDFASNQDWTQVGPCSHKEYMWTGSSLCETKRTQS